MPLTKNRLVGPLGVKKMCNMVLFNSSIMLSMLEIVTHLLDLVDNFQLILESCAHLPCSLIFSISLCHLEGLPSHLKSPLTVHCCKLP